MEFLKTPSTLIPGFDGRTENLATQTQGSGKSVTNMDGVGNNLASKYSFQQAMTRNCSIEKLKPITETGSFNRMNDTTSKFVSTRTEATENRNRNTILYYKNVPNIPNN